ncbi:hypothetical protein F9K87_06150 [Brucella anthropi]|uniref:hypothetical protein n=1 Tax=Brucella anthropi TaxID=529 RepID=UPI00124CD5D4|nr:hypothetical protein [Brucella anthropi]KAB2801013.1 hypothetical protein F9K87_06150 [Brucella anthropi]
MKTDHLDYRCEDSHLAEVGLIGIAEYQYENHYAMVVEGDRSPHRALLFFLNGKCVLSQRHQQLLALPNAFVSPTITAQSIIMNGAHARPGSIIIEKSEIFMVALKEGDWQYVSLHDGTVSRHNMSFQPYTQTWQLLCPDHSGALEILYSFEPDSPTS